MTYIILLRNVLMHELNNGKFDILAWVYLYGLAKARVCYAIADQVDGYIREYEGK